eukprot:CAMPEP_0176456996 /NCGR_PEP_ID=MMETSP0127-20121128/31644_1 /TAXON_ID=938130 /ORGANISM="Platyophrya macrostoma, Strain WH" /LENGTH=48 /DNA_ID= /DNA_START= /DNA_END= /DNA_ORIENTATION=
MSSPINKEQATTRSQCVERHHAAVKKRRCKSLQGMEEKLTPMALVNQK